MRLEGRLLTQPHWETYGNSLHDGKKYFFWQKVMTAWSILSVFYKVSSHWGWKSSRSTPYTNIYHQNSCCGFWPFLVQTWVTYRPVSIQQASNYCLFQHQYSAGNMSLVGVSTFSTQLQTEWRILLKTKANSSSKKAPFLKKINTQFSAFYHIFSYKTSLVFTRNTLLLSILKF